MSDEWAQGVAYDGAVFFRNGEPQTIEQVLEALRLSTSQAERIAELEKAQQEELEAFHAIVNESQGTSAFAEAHRRADKSLGVLKEVVARNTPQTGD